MRIVDCTLLLFQRKLDPLTMDPDQPGPKPSWGVTQGSRRGIYTFVFIGMAFDSDDLPNVVQPLI